MAWHSTWPLGTASVRANRLTGQENTSYTETTLNVNHYWNDGASTDGKHRFVTMPNQSTNPAVAGGEGGLFTKNIALLIPPFTTHAELLYKYSSGFVSRLTDNGSVPLAIGRSSLIGTEAAGISIEWGFDFKPSGGETTFQTPFSATPWSVVCTIFGSNTRKFLYVQTIEADKFKVQCLDSDGVATSLAYTWIAIGPT